MLRVGFISAWHVHADGYAKELQDSGKVEIKAIWDYDTERGKQWAEKFGAEFIADYDAFLGRSDIDAVICNSPTTMHPELLEKAAVAKKHIFTEKLLAVTTAECQKLSAAIESSGVTFTISLPLRADAKMLYAKKLVEEGGLGRVSGARMRRSHSGVSDNWLPQYWYDVAMTGGGAMMDLGAHPVYILSFLFGKPKRLSCLASNLYGTTSDENTIAVAEFEGGILGTCETAFVTYGVPDILEIYGTEGSLFIQGQEVRLVTKALKEQGVDSATPMLPEKKPSPLLQFVDACLNGTGTPEYLGTGDALTMTAMIEAAYASENSGKTMNL